MQRLKRLLRDLIARSALAAAGLLALAVCASSYGYAGPRASPGTKSLEAGIEAYQEGAIEVAVETLSDALLQGKLSETRTAQALYYRGLAYRELGKPGQAIADLTKAMAAKNALSKADLKIAARNRAGAYREAGLASTETPVRPGEQSRVRVQVPPGRVPVPVAVDAVAAADHWGTTSSIDAPAPAAPSAPSWGETSVKFAPAAAP